KIKTYGSLTTQVKQDRKELLTLTNTKKLKESQSNQFKKNKKSLEQKTPQDTHKITETDQKITAIEEEIREITHAIQEKQVSIAAMQTTLREITHTIFPPDAVDTIVNLIFDAYQESLPGEEQRYISYTVHNILLGFLWRKATTKQDFLDYFSTVGADILSNPEIISNPEAQKKWLVQAYLPEEIRNYGSFFSAMEMSAEKKEAVSYEFEQLAVYTYANKLYEKQTFPPQAAGGDPTYQGIQFADCGETSLRNFFNNILYNSTTLIFDFDLLERSFGADAIHPKLKQFYHSPLSSVGNINSTQTLNAWAAVVSGLNIEGPEPIAYRTSEVCEIDAGISNMLRVINRLIGVTTFKELVEKLNAAGLHITVENRSRNNFGEVHFTIGNWEKFVWHFETNHFYITIQELTKIENPNIPIVMVRLMLLISNLYDTGKNNELFNIIMLYANNMYNKFLIDRIQANNFPSPYILHVYLSFNNLMDHQEKLEFIKKILDNDVLGGLPNNLSIDALIINIIKKLPTDFYYINEIMKILSENLKKLRKSKPLSTYFQDHLDMIAQKYRE
ncbi:MAG: hypothetical protein Q8Q25_03020, partial [bacterium]|nr:hypothetical protein [bacterium]